MCGRFILLTDLSVIIKLFDIQNVAGEYRPGNNISPCEQIAAVVRKDDQNNLVDFRWGLIPSWAKDPSIGNNTINAQAESIAEKPSFKYAFQKRRCLIPADGYYEWQKLGKAKKPFRIYLKSEQPMGFAGLYETWMSPEKKRIDTCAIVTVLANELTMPLHDRMPAILPKDKEAFWLDPENHDQRGLWSILKPYPSDEMAVSEVDPRTFYGRKVESAFLDV